MSGLPSLVLYEPRKNLWKEVREEKSLTFSAIRTFFRFNFFPDPDESCFYDFLKSPYTKSKTFSTKQELFLQIGTLKL